MKQRLHTTKAGRAAEAGGASSNSASRRHYNVNDNNHYHCSTACHGLAGFRRARKRRKLDLTTVRSLQTPALRLAFLPGGG